MTSITSQLTLYNGALRIIKQARLESLTEDVDARYHLDDEYGKVKAYLLEQGLWNFAARTIEIQANPSVEPEYGPSFAHDKPSDFVRLIKISANSHLYPSLRDYLDEQIYWITNIDPIYVQYVSDDNEYGGDLALWPATYELAVEYELAFRIAPHLTALSDADLERLEAQRTKAIRDARSKDALNQANERAQPGRMVRSRGTSHSSGGRPWWR